MRPCNSTIPTEYIGNLPRLYHVVFLHCQCGRRMPNAADSTSTTLRFGPGSVRRERYCLLRLQALLRIRTARPLSHRTMQTPMERPTSPLLAHHKTIGPSRCDTDVLQPRRQAASRRIRAITSAGQYRAHTNRHNLHAYCTMVSGCQTFWLPNFLVIRYAWRTSKSRIPLFTISNLRHTLSDRIRGVESRSTGYQQCRFIGRPFLRVSSHMQGETLGALR